MTTTDFEFSAPIEKRAGLLRGVFYKADEIDTQGDYVTSATLEQMAHDALANGVTIDVQHDRRDSGAKLVESHVADGAWVGAVRPTAQILQAVDAGEYRAFSIYGVAQRVAKEVNGVPANELVRPKITHVSIVASGANRERFVVKSDVRAQLAEIDATLSAIREQHDFRARAALPGIRKAVETEHEIRREQQVLDLRAQLGALHERLHRSWDKGDTELEKRSLLRIDDLETELLALGHRIDPVPFDNFAARGGQSSVIDASVGLDLRAESQLGVRHDPRVAKAAAELDLSDDLGIAVRRPRRR